MENSPSKGSIKVLHVILLQSKFQRSPIVVQNAKEKIDLNIGVSPSFDAEKGRIVTQVKLEMNSKYEKETQYEAEIVMAGEFEVNNVPKDFQDSFSKVNAPAIVFPFVREHLMSLTQKAGINPIAVNPVNFVELAKRSTEERSA